MTGAGQGGFAASGAVGRYWLARCDGFEVRSSDGRALGTVSRVELGLGGHASTLRVERRRGSSLRLGAASAALVDPWRQLVVVTLPPPAALRAKPARGASQAVGRAGRIAAGQIVRSGRSFRRGAVASLRRGAPRARRAALWLAARTAYAVAFAGWLYGASLLFLSRVAVRLLLPMLAGIVRVAVFAAPRLGRGARDALGVGLASVRRLRRPRFASSPGRRAAQWVPRRH